MTRFSYEEECQKTFLAGTSTTFLAVTGLQLCACLLTSLLIIVFSLKFFSKNHYHLNAKILVSGQMLFTSIFCFPYIVGIGMHAYDVIFNYNDHCAFVKYAEDCRWFYYSHVFAVASMVLNQVSLSAERVISCAYSKKYETFGCAIGVTFLILETILAASVTCFILSDFDMQEMRPTCMGIPFSARPKSNILFALVFLSDIVSLLLFFVTWIISKKGAADSSQYFLGRQYQKRENVQIIRMFVPVLIAHLLAYSIYAITMILIRKNLDEMNPVTFLIVAASAMTIPYYTAFELIYLLFALRRMDQKNKIFTENVQQNSKDEVGDAYFESLRRQWEE